MTPALDRPDQTDPLLTTVRGVLSPSVGTVVLSLSGREQPLHLERRPGTLELALSKTSWGSSSAIIATFPCAARRLGVTHERAIPSLILDLLEPCLLQVAQQPLDSAAAVHADVDLREVRPVSRFEALFQFRPFIGYIAFYREMSGLLTAFLSSRENKIAIVRGLTLGLGWRLVVGSLKGLSESTLFLASRFSGLKILPHLDFDDGSTYRSRSEI